MTMLTLGVVFFALWLVSLRLRDASIVDIAWGPVFSVVPAVALLRGAEISPRCMLVFALLLAWGLRLGVHLFLRNRGHGEDYRYAQMRLAHGRRFAWVSLFTIFSLQACLVFVISLPLQVVFSTGALSSITHADAIASIVFLVGFGFETAADWQLTRFRRDPAMRGRVLDQGLWRYSRHPNYFGDAMVWWSFGLFGAQSALAEPGVGVWPLVGALLGPFVMTFLLLRVSGVSLLERTIVERRPEYAAYIARTSAFIPLPWALKRRTVS
jgi:steroid 5-alpha reductase family enzyme